MHRPVCALLLAVSVGGIVVACGNVEDESLECEAGDPTCGRPLDLEYLTEAIFAPSCGQTQCHSKFHQAGGLVFDNPHDARASLLVRTGNPPLLNFDSEQYDPFLEKTPNLVRWLTETDPFIRGIGRMPFDAPLPDRDIRLIEYWIRAPYTLTNGTEHAGGLAKGAQCNPEDFDGFACNYIDKVKCNADWNFGEQVEACRECAYRETSPHKFTLDCVPE